MSQSLYITQAILNHVKPAQNPRTVSQIYQNQTDLPYPRPAHRQKKKRKKNFKVPLF